MIPLTTFKRITTHPGFLKWGFFTAAILYILLFIAPSLMGLPLGDEGIYILQSLAMHHGAVPYRDFSAGIFPATLYFASTLFAWVGDSISALRMAMFSILAITLWLTLKMGSRYLTRSTSTLLLVFFTLIILPTTFAFTHHVLSGPLSLWTIYFINRYLQTPQRRFLVLASLLTACVLLATQSLGVLLCASMAVFLSCYLSVTTPGPTSAHRTLQALKAVTLYFLLPFVLLLAAVGWGLFQQGILTDFYKETILWIFQGTYAKSTSFLYFSTGFLEFLQPLVINPGNGPLVILWQAFPLSFAYILVAWLPVFGGLWGTEVLLRGIFKKRTSIDWQLLLLVLGTIVLLASSMTYSTSYHIALNGWTGYLLAAMALQNLMRTPKLKRYQVPAYGIALLYILYTFAYQTQLNFGILQEGKQSSKLRSYGTVESSFAHPLGPRNAYIDSLVVEMIRQATHPGDPIFVFSATPYLYILSDRPMATRFFMLYPVINSEAQIQEAVQTLQANPPRVIIDDMKLAPMIKSDHRFAHYRNLPPFIPGLKQLLETHYKAYQIDHYRVYILQAH